jgi:hypothetical protein
MDGVEKLVQMNEVERMREIMDLISDKMHKQNDKDRIEMLAMLASTTAMEANLMSVNFARRANTKATGTKTKKNKGKAIMKGVEQAENGKDNDNNPPSSSQSQNNATQNQQSQQQSQQKNQQQQQQPVNTLATRTQQAIDKKKKMARKVTTGTVKPYSTI